MPPPIDLFFEFELNGCRVNGSRCDAASRLITFDPFRDSLTSFGSVSHLLFRTTMEDAASLVYAYSRSFYEGCISYTVFRAEFR